MVAINGKSMMKLRKLRYGSLKVRKTVKDLLFVWLGGKAKDLRICTTQLQAGCPAIQILPEFCERPNYHKISRFQNWQTY